MRFISSKTRLFSSMAFNPNITPRISLDATEQKIKGLLVEFASIFNQSHSDPVVLRITGGWVRDKLLGRVSHDIDIAVSTCTGLVFAEALNKYISENATRFELEPSSIHKIEKNPQKSKHLETATTKLYGLDIDFVNLRAEEYADNNSRIPSNIRFGTAEEDAYRRDATLNALFYNLQEDKVEDFTNRGLQDLHDGILRTPLPPFVTFHEDPLRVLRLIRFSSAFGFEIEQSAIEAMKDERIKDAIVRKISRERVGIEIAKILNSQLPWKGLNTISELGLEDSIFLLFDEYKPSRGFKHPQSKLKEAIDVVNSLNSSTSLQSSLHPELKNEINSPNLWLAAALNHWGVIEGINEKKKPAPLVFLIIRDGLKLSINEGKLIADMYSCEEQIQASADNLEQLGRRELGVLVRTCGEKWRLCFIFALVKELMKTSSYSQTIDKYTQLINKIISLDVTNAWNLRPLVNGKQIQETFGLRRGGPYLAEAIDELIGYQLQHPDATQDECLEYVKTLKSRYVQ